MSPQYRIKNWHEFQHFKDRNPLWIKLYRKILDQRDIMTLSAEYFRLLVCLWLLASEDKDKQGRLPSLEDMAWRLKMEPSSLYDAISHLDNFVISDGYQDDALEKRREETEKEKRREEVPTLRYSLEDCHKAAEGIGVAPDMIEAFFVHYAAVDFVDGAGRPIKSLHHALQKWKITQPSHGKSQGRHDPTLEQTIAQSNRIEEEIRKRKESIEAERRKKPQLVEEYVIPKESKP
jgi:hypothetical protein